MSRRSKAEGIFNNIFDTIKEKQNDIGGAVNEYTSNASHKPTMDVIEDNENIAVITDLPGVDKSNIKIDLTEDTLEITAQYNEEPNGKNFVRKERKYGPVNRTIDLPAKIKLDATSAVFENGVLTIILSKIDEESVKINVD
jgi:HSP20 family protein